MTADALVHCHSCCTKPHAARSSARLRVTHKPRRESNPWKRPRGMSFALLWRRRKTCMAAAITQFTISAGIIIVNAAIVLTRWADVIEL